MLDNVWLTCSPLLNRSWVLLQVDVHVIALAFFIIILICCNSAMTLSWLFPSSLGWAASVWVPASFVELWYCSISLFTFVCSSKHRKFKEPGLFTGFGVDVVGLGATASSELEFTDCSASIDIIY